MVNFHLHLKTVEMWVNFIQTPNPKNVKSYLVPVTNPNLKNCEPVPPLICISNLKDDHATEVFGAFYGQRCSNRMNKIMNLLNCELEYFVAIQSKKCARFSKVIIDAAHFYKQKVHYF